jgi:hypothetical protein
MYGDDRPVVLLNLFFAERKTSDQWNVKPCFNRHAWRRLLLLNGLSSAFPCPVDVGAHELSDNLRGSLVP